MVDINYANSYKEVLEVINNLVKEDYDKIPTEYIEFLKENCNNDYEFNYDKTKPFAEQELLENSKYILFGLFEKYGTTEIQKEKINNFKKKYYNKLEEEKKEKYSTNDLFKDIRGNEENNEQIPIVPMIKAKESILKKIINKLKEIFYRK